MSLLRSHLTFPVVDTAGNIRPSITVRFYEPHTLDLIDETIYALNSGNAELSQPITFEDGVVNAYLARPKTVRVGIEPAGQAEFFLEDFQFATAGNNAVISPTVLVINNTPSPGFVLTGNNDGTAQFKALNLMSAPGTLGAEDNPFTTAYFIDTNNTVWGLSIDTDGHPVVTSVDPVLDD